MVFATFLQKGACGNIHYISKDTENNSLSKYPHHFSAIHRHTSDYIKRQSGRHRSSSSQNPPEQNNSFQTV